MRPHQQGFEHGANIHAPEVVSSLHFAIVMRQISDHALSGNWAAISIVANWFIHQHTYYVDGQDVSTPAVDRFTNTLWA